MSNRYILDLYNEYTHTLCTYIEIYVKNAKIGLVFTLIFAKSNSIGASMLLDQQTFSLT